MKLGKSKIPPEEYLLPPSDFPEIGILIICCMTLVGGEGRGGGHKPVYYIGQPALKLPPARCRMEQRMTEWPQGCNGQRIQLWQPAGPEPGQIQKAGGPMGI